MALFGITLDKKAAKVELQGRTKTGPQPRKRLKRKRAKHEHPETGLASGPSNRGGREYGFIVHEARSETKAKAQKRAPFETLLRALGLTVNFGH